MFPNRADIDAARAALGPLPDGPTQAADVIEELCGAVEPLLVSTTGPRFFGFVVGGALDAATAADMLTTGWDQPAFNAVTSPAAALAEDVTGGWLKELLGLPSAASFGFVTGAQAANTVGLAAARHHVLAPGRMGRRAARVARRAPRYGWSRTASGTRRSIGRCGSSASERRPRTGGHRRPGCDRRRRSGARSRRLAAGTDDRLPPGREREHAVRSTISSRRQQSPTTMARGSMSTVRSDCGRRPARRGATSWTGSRPPTRGGPTATSG